MNFRYKNDHMNGPQKPATVIFLYDLPGNLESRTEISSFRRYFNPLMDSGAYKGKFLECVNFYTPFKDEAWLILVGLGKPEDLTEARMIECGALAAGRIRELNLKEGFICLPPVDNWSYAKVMALLVIGARLAIEKLENLKTNPEEMRASHSQRLKNLFFHYLGSKDPMEKPQTIINKADMLAMAQLHARTLTDLPPNVLYPESFAGEAKKLALKYKLRISVWESDKIQLEGAGGIDAVGGGSVHEPNLVILEYDGKPDSTEAPIALVGKGITFDSGGLCLKPADGMAGMKGDMAGAAVVLAVISAAAELGLKQKLVGVMPLAENMTGSRAYRPSDVIKTLSGHTVEVVNTDAEGRLVLADGITVALKYRPSILIDIATLTGACQVALGTQYAGIFSDDKELTESIIETGREVGENFWPLPLAREYEDEIKSEMADFKHMGGRAGGAINAALFLKKFVKSPIPWAHLDIAGVARASKKTPSCPEGSTGFGTRTLLRYIMKNPLA
ncbi:MAG: leucyl aminopeptidase family protein [Deltaproteobacteria bacterium]|jgi:leucyl aminopeptidase|nr:leucyl aminopeptidase family protein [Deltaproteobacteria bacterium]